MLAYAGIAHRKDDCRLQIMQNGAWAMPRLLLVAAAFFAAYYVGKKSGQRTADKTA